MTDLSTIRREIIEYCLTLPFSYEDYQFDDVADAGAWTVMRHKANKKGFAHIYERHGKLCVNLKCDPFESDFLRQAFVDVIPAYHRNFCFACGCSPRAKRCPPDTSASAENVAKARHFLNAPPLFARFFYE